MANTRVVSFVCLCLFAQAIQARMPSTTVSPRTLRTQRDRTQFPPAPTRPPRVLSPIPICAVTGTIKAGAHVAVADCDSLETAAQSFLWAGATIVSASDASLCLTVGRDVDPDSGTSALVRPLPCLRCLCPSSAHAHCNRSSRRARRAMHRSSSPTTRPTATL